MVGTRSGWLGEHEVVEVNFDPEVVSYARLAELAREHDCATHAFVRGEPQRAAAERWFGDQALPASGAIRVDDLKYHLARTALRHVPMSELQAVRINAHLGRGHDVDDLLTAAQRRLRELVAAHPQEAWPEAVGREPIAAWRSCLQVADRIRRR